MEVEGPDRRGVHDIGVDDVQRVDVENEIDACAPELFPERRRAHEACVQRLEPEASRRVADDRPIGATCQDGGDLDGWA
jgi:hypothetical protein